MVYCVEAFSDVDGGHCAFGFPSQEAANAFVASAYRDVTMHVEPDRIVFDPLPGRFYVTETADHGNTVGFVTHVVIYERETSREAPS